MSNDVGEVVQRVLRDGPFSMRQLADDAGVKYGVLRAWAMGRRTPTPENVARIAHGFEVRAHRLLELATDLKDSVENGNRRAVEDRDGD